MIAAEYPKNDSIQGDFEVIEIPKITYAVFTDSCPLSEAIGIKVAAI